MGPLKTIKTTVPSVRGDIDVELRNDADVFILKLNSPEATTAIVGIPKRPDFNITSITANRETIWKNGKPKGRRGLDFLEETEHYIKFSVQPGRWAFESELSQ